jgi:uncharacterized protein (TIGR00297 family)
VTTWLSPGGTLAAVAVGALVAVGLGWAGIALLGAFFLSSTLLTPGGGRRRAVQVVANGGVAAAAAVLAPGHPAWTAAFAGALAAAAADTWSTEIGARSRRPPRLIMTGDPVAAGTSGGVTWLGTAAGAAGATFIAAAAALLSLARPRGAALVAIGGFGGCLADSILGATLQARYRCPACGATAETPRPCCGRLPDLSGGLRWMTNDTVNLLATVVGACVAVLPALAGVATLPLP